MGLDISHDAWHGAYSAFMRWREKIAEVAGLPPLELMEGFYFDKGSEYYTTNMFTLIDYAFPKGDELEVSAISRLRKKLPIKWASLKPNPLYELLSHSDCDGFINWSKCNKIAHELEKLIPLLPDEDNGGHIGNWREKTKQFAEGLRLAYSKKERLKFR